MPLSIEEEFRAKLHPDAVKGAGSFEPKLTFEQRCEIYALDKIGSKRVQIAAAYNIARPTVAYICNSASRHYRNVRKHYAELGKDAFIRKYLTDEVMQKYASYVGSIRANLSDADDKIERRTQAEMSSTPKANATGAEGTYNLWSEREQRAERVTVLWVEGEGWRVELSAHTAKSLKAGDQPVMWPGEGDVFGGVYPTSSAALKAYEKARPGYDFEKDF